MKEVKVLGVNVCDYEGEGDPLIFVHSFPMNSRMWDRQTEYFKKHFRVITYDLRGMGKSSSDDNVITMEKLVNDFFHILNNLKLRKVHAVGLSMGGYILLRSVIKDPDRFISLTAVNTKSEKDDDETLLRRSNAVIKIKSGGRDAFTGKLLKNLTESADESLIGEIKNIIDMNTDDGICGNLLAMSTRVNTADDLSALKIPVLLAASGKDKITPPENLMRLFDIFRKGSPDGMKAFYNFAGCGHLCNMEKPHEFNRLLYWFLNCIEIERRKG